MPPLQPRPNLHPYRLFHLSARLRLRDRPSPSSPPPPKDDYYTLLLSQPLPSRPAQKPLNPAPAPAPKPSIPTSSSPAVPPPSPSFSAASSVQASDKGPDNRVLFSTPLAGPSARMRGLARGERGLARPPEPDNCCMSGCVNCVWDAYREEVEEWAAARRMRDERGAVSGGVVGKDGGGVKGVGMERGDEGAVRDMDEVGGFRGGDLGREDEGEGGLFEGVPVGIREFMSTEKRLRERRAAGRPG